jgi:protein subunit release factor A
MAAAFIELHARYGGGINSCRTFHQVCSTFVKYLEAEQCYVDILDEAYEESSSDRDWKYIALHIFDTKTVTIAELENLIQDPLKREIQSISVYEDSHPQVEINPSELAASYYRPNKPDCQFIFHTESCVEIKHLPTGLTVRSESERSRHKNYANALSFLRAKLTRWPE